MLKPRRPEIGNDQYRYAPLAGFTFPPQAPAPQRTPRQAKRPRRRGVAPAASRTTASAPTPVPQGEVGRGTKSHCPASLIGAQGAAAPCTCQTGHLLLVFAFGEAATGRTLTSGAKGGRADASHCPASLTSAQGASVPPPSRLNERRLTPPPLLPVPPYPGGGWEGDEVPFPKEAEPTFVTFLTKSVKIAARLLQCGLVSVTMYWVWKRPKT